MELAAFLGRARTEARRYGADPLVFVRELVQNARDAGARRVLISSAESDEPAAREQIAVTDDGCGMSPAAARDFLFRLYASSKEGDPQAIGHFGVGFWSVLLWDPEVITVTSNDGSGAWLVRLDLLSGKVDWRSAPPTARGTSIVLERPSRGLIGWRERLRHVTASYCRFVRLRDSVTPLPVEVDGAPINQTLGLPGGIQGRFAGPGVRGVVGLGPAPQVDLYARGLFVRRVAVLDELLGESPRPMPPREDGLAPVVLLDCDDVRLVMSRRRAVPSRAMRRAVALAGRELSRLVGRLADGVVRRGPRERVLEMWDGAWRALGGAWGVAALAAWLLVLGGGAWLWLYLFANSGRVGGPAPVLSSSLTPRPFSGVWGYDGARVDVVSGNEPPVDLSYSPARGELFFKALTLSQFDAQRGWVQDAVMPLTPLGPFSCEQDCIDVSLTIEGSGTPVPLLVPTGYRIVPSSINPGGEVKATAWLNRHGDPWVEVAAGQRVRLRYRVGPGAFEAQPRRWLFADDLPNRLAPPMEALRQMPLTDRVWGTARLVGQLLRYDVSAEAARKFNTGPGRWIDRVLQSGVGDCDVHNGVNAVLLNGLGVASRVAVGVVGVNGKARSGYHAWTEYWSSGWRVADASAVAMRSDVAPVALAPVKVGESVGPALARPRRDGEERSPGAGARKGKRRDAEAAEASGRGAADRSALPTSAIADAATPGAPSDVPLSISPLPSTVAGLGAPGADSALGPGVSFAVDDLPEGRRLPPLWVGGAGVLLVALLVWASARSWRASVVGRDLLGEVPAMKQALARLLLDAVTRPAGWRRVGGLWRRRLLPTVSGRRLSLAEALERGAGGGLFRTDSRSGLAVSLAQAGTVVLDGSDRELGPVIRALGRAVNLDDIDALDGPTVPALNPHTAGVVAVVNRWLAGAGIGVEVRLSAALAGDDTRDVDLRAARRPTHSRWPRAWVAVGHLAAPLRAIGREATPTVLDAFVLLEWLLERSELLAERRRLVRAAAALRALGEDAR